MQNNKELTPLESLELIQSMIERTKGHVADNSFYFLLWGWMVFICSLIEYILKVWLHFDQHYLVWLSMPAGGVISVLYGMRHAQKNKIRTYVNEALDYLWIAIFLAFMALVFINSKNAYWENVFTYYILLYAIGTFVSGKLMRFRPLVIGGLINFVLAAISGRFSFDNQLLIAALAILTSYIIPGHLLKIRFQQQTK